MRSIANILDARGYGRVPSQDSILDLVEEKKAQRAEHGEIVANNIAQLRRDARDFFQGDKLNARPTNVLYKRYSALDEAIQDAVTPGQLARLGLKPFEFASRWAVPVALTATPVYLFTITLQDKDVVLITDWLNFAHKNIGGNLVAMTTGEIPNDVLEIQLQKNYGGGITQRISTNTAADTRALNGCATLSSVSGSTGWPGRMCEIIHGPGVISITGSHVGAPAAPFALPTTWTTMLLGYWNI